LVDHKYKEKHTARPLGKELKQRRNSLPVRVLKCRVTLPGNASLQGSNVEDNKRFTLGREKQSQR